MENYTSARTVQFNTHKHTITHAYTHTESRTHGDAVQTFANSGVEENNACGQS